MEQIGVELWRAVFVDKEGRQTSLFIFPNEHNYMEVRKGDICGKLLYSALGSYSSLTVGLDKAKKWIEEYKLKNNLTEITRLTI